MNSSEPTIYEHLGGREALLRLAAAQYRRCLTDPVLTPVVWQGGPS
jgi:truncated hemoglobin YjbI